MTYEDIIFPKNNEEEFIDIAKILGFRSITFAYELKSNKKEDIKKTLEDINKIKKQFEDKDKTKEVLSKNENLTIKTAIVIDESLNKKLTNNNLDDIKNKVDIIMFDASEATELRTVAKNKFIDIIFKQELTKNKDFMHQRNPGIDEVICKIASESDTSFGFSLNDITNLRDKRMIGRVAQSLKICKKYKCNINIFSFAVKPYEMKAPKDMISLFFLIGTDKKTSRIGMKKKSKI